jgi:hypothetical protein
MQSRETMQRETMQRETMQREMEPTETMPREIIRLMKVTHLFLNQIRIMSRSI